MTRDELAEAVAAAAPEPVPAREDGLEVVEVDTLIERADLGDGCFTLVAAGDPVPAGLAGLPRRERPTDSA